MSRIICHYYSMTKQLNFKGKVNLLAKFADDFSKGLVQDCYVYSINDSDEDSQIQSTATIAALRSFLSPPITKIAFDTRKFNSETERNPRSNLQNYHSSAKMLEDEDIKKIEILSKLIDPIQEIKNMYEKDPDWQDSYSRILLDNLDKTLLINQKELDIFGPQLEYLMQILYLRYRLTQEDILSKTKDELKHIILSKDEKLLKKASVHQVLLQKQAPALSNNKQINNDSTQNAIINAIFGNNNIRKDGEKTVERTITITIKDSVID